eukprot:14185611-Alexandrium_andersonii.AAC.1
MERAWTAAQASSVPVRPSAQKLQAKAKNARWRCPGRYEKCCPAQAKAKMSLRPLAKPRRTS